MNNKIKIYCIILSILYTVVVICSMSDTIESFKAGYKIGRESSPNTPWYMLTLHLRVLPIEGLHTYPEKIINSVTGQEVRAEANNYKIRIENSNIDIPVYVKVFRGFIIALSVVFLAGIIYLPFLFFSVIKSATKGKILEPKVIHKIQRIGYILIIYYLIDSLAYFSDYLVAQYVMTFEKYRAVIDVSDFGLLFLGLVTLLMTEILKVSRQMKEEQDLTI
ncbi:DUF2975 domain-containing protein [Dysgonomonas sp. HDW5B]|uniref:DUF2975 domain-containing protein n=1 Tax=Dysgonomonas sp. HDW5B TaxID=2714927 RepID=UPI00140CE81E|nr:DUF2975 domain-containing protein [Dysgonomonas sp. HDW5B]QIK55176.1 DUF2975 domain-containing protein [Dysgonomonas sp. HDW5B]